MKLLSIIIICLTITNVHAQRDFSDSEVTKVVLLGTGMPEPNPVRSGCSVAIIVNAMPYIVDFGPGVVRQLAALTDVYATSDNIIKGLKLKNTTRAFLTHLHSDHTTGYPDLILTPWVGGRGGDPGRDEPLEVFGPEGIIKMTELILGAYEEDIKYRLYSTQPANNQGWRVNPHEIEKEGVVYEDSNVKVEAFPAPHGSWPNAWSYGFTTPDKTIVISGDTGPSEKLMEYSRGVDILVHGVYSGERVDLIPESWKIYMSQNHTSTYKLAEIATKAQPKVLVLYHTLPLGTTDGSLLEEIQSKYSGRVHLANDLDIF